MIIFQKEQKKRNGLKKLDPTINYFELNDTKMK